jgi:hypothetical protein
MKPTFSYKPLESYRHIRLLEVLVPDSDEPTGVPVYRLVHRELSTEVALEFEAVSYTWGDPKRVADLRFKNVDGVIGLTHNLSQALPYLAKHSRTKLLWIDQICINQADPVEKPKTVARMSEIYRAASRVIIWLGPDDEHSHLCKRWLSEVDKMIHGMTNSDRMTRDSQTFNSDIRYLVVRSTFTSPVTDPIYAPAIREFWSRQWFSRGWIVQELLLARDNVFLTSDLTFSMEDLKDLQTVPPNHKPEEADANQRWFSYNILMDLKLHPFTDEQPLRFLRTMHLASAEFQTSEMADRLYAFLGLIEASGFTPDYTVPFRANLIKFASALAQSFGSLDFLSMWSANLDDLLPNTPEDMKGLPSWVPSWSAIPLSAPFRLGVGGVRSLRHTIGWNAASGRKHAHLQECDAGTSGCLSVRGRIVDYVDKISSARFQRYWDADNEYLDGLVNNIKHDIPGLDPWKQEDMIQFLMEASYNGTKAEETVEEVLGLKARAWDEVRNMFGYNESLALCLSMGRGRRFVRTETGKLGLAPFIGSKARDENRRGSIIAILHGCIVPVVLEPVTESSNKYRLVGDCYVEGIMHGEAVAWGDNDAHTFILV